MEGRSKLVSEKAFMRLLMNGHQSAGGDAIDPQPVVKVFTPDAAATWLLTEVDPDDEDRAFGLCDLGLGFPELGWVRFSELEEVRGRLNLPVEIDLHFSASQPLSAYASEAREHGRLIA